MSDKIKLTQPSLPALPQPRASDPSTQRLYDAIKEYLETVRGTRGNPMDRAVFIGDLVATGLLSYSNGTISPGPGIPGDIGDIDGSDDMTTPPALTNIVASAGFTSVLLTWNDPQFGRLKWYEIWRREVDDGITVADNENFYYDKRITAGERTEMEALFALGTAATAQEVRLREALDALLGLDADYYAKFWAAALDENNTTKRAELTEIAEQLKAARIAVETARADDPSAWAVRRGVALSPVFSDTIDRGKTYLYWVRAVSVALVPGPFNASGLQVTAAPDIEALMKELTREVNNSLIADFIFNGINMQGYAGFGEAVTLGESIVQQQAWINDMNAGWGVRIEISANGKPYAVGFGLNVDITDPNDPQSTFLVRADRFAVLDPDDEELAPFIIDDGKVYIDTALIRRASITELLAGYVVADYIRVGSGIQAAHINGATFNIGNWVQTNPNDPNDPYGWVWDPVPGRQGNFSVDEAGNMQARLAELNGVIIRDTSGNIVLDTVTGTYGSALVSTGNPINSSNVGTFISRLAVNTLHIAGNAVTVPESAQSTTRVPLSGGSWLPLINVSMTLATTGEVLVDEDVPVLIQWAAECDAENNDARARSFRIRQVCASILPEDQVVYESFSGARNTDQYNSGVLKAIVQAGEPTTWYLECKGNGNVYQSNMTVTAVRR